MIKAVVAFITLVFIIAIVGAGVYFGTQAPKIEQTQKELEIPYDSLVSPKAPPAPIAAPAPVAPTQPTTEAPANETPAAID